MCCLSADSPDKLKHALSEQYGDLLPPTDKMEIHVGYFQHSKKNVNQKSLRLTDEWKLVQRGKG